MIKQWHEQGVSVSEIARRTGHDRKTIRRVLQEPLVVQAPRSPKRRKIDPYVAYLQQRMELGVYNAHKLYLEIQVQGYPGGETQVRWYVQQQRPPRAHQQATVRFETAPGQQAQVDWGSFGYAVLDGKRERLYAFLMTLSWSRMVYLEFSTRLETSDFLRGHQHAFEYFGGVPREVLHDNLKSAVLERDSNGMIHWNARYLDFALVHGFRPHACQPYRAQTKGKIERGVGYVRGNFWPGIAFSSLADLNQQAQTWCNTVANPRVHATTGEVPFSRFPQEGLQPLPARRYDIGVVALRRVSKDCLVSYDGNYYSVPAAYVRQTLALKILESGELVVVDGVGQVVAQHRLLSGRRQRAVIPVHYAALASSNGRRAAEQCLLHCVAPEVEIRPLSVYAALAEGGQP